MAGWKNGVDADIGLNCGRERRSKVDAIGGR